MRRSVLQRGPAGDRADELFISFRRPSHLHLLSHLDSDWVQQLQVQQGLQCPPVLGETRPEVALLSCVSGSGSSCLGVVLFCSAPDCASSLECQKPPQVSSSSVQTPADFSVSLLVQSLPSVIVLSLQARVPCPCPALLSPSGHCKGL